jgi:hypothetical protein
MQVWPVAAKMPDTTPLTAGVEVDVGEDDVGDLPPISRLMCLRSRPAAALIVRPAVSKPVKLIFRMSGGSTSGAPTSLLKPVTTLTTPADRQAS